MRNTLIFAGSSCPALASKICENLGMEPAEAELSQFSNGETSVRILTSVREKDVFVVQSGSPKINDTIMELLIMISACKGGSANKVTGTCLRKPNPSDFPLPPQAVAFFVTASAVARHAWCAPTLAYVLALPDLALTCTQWLTKLCP